MIEFETSASNYDAITGISHYFNHPQSIENRFGKFRVPILRKGLLSDLTFDQKSLTITGDPGLREYLKIAKEQGSSYIFDSHNFAFFAWVEAMKEGKISPGSLLIHFDEHGDNKIPPQLNISRDSSLQEVASYTLGLDKNEFIVPAVRLGLLNKAEYIAAGFGDNRDRDTSVDDDYFPIHQTGVRGDWLQQFLNLAVDPKKLIVDIDIDYFSDPTFDKNSQLWGFETLEERIQYSIKVMRQLIKKAGVVTIATSPSHFRDQPKAIQIVKELLK